MGNVNEVLPMLQQQTAAPIADAESFNLLCRTYFMIEEWDHAISACERARNLDPTSSLNLLWLGRAYGEKADRAGFFSAAGLAGKVRSSFERAVELNPQDWEARTDLAEFYLEAPSIVGGGKDKARLQADALMSLNPGMAHWILARIASKDKDMATTEREYRAEVASTHEAARGWLDLASFFSHTNRYEEMEQALHSLETARLDRADSLLDGARMLQRTGRDPSLAVRLLRRYLAASVEEGPAFKARDLLGQFLEKQGDLHGAAEEFRAALALYRNYTRAQQDLQRVGH